MAVKPQIVTPGVDAQPSAEPGVDYEVTVNAKAGPDAPGAAVPAQAMSAPPEPLDAGSPFAGAFYPEPGNRVEVAAGGPFAEGIKMLAKGMSPMTVDASSAALARHTDILKGLGVVGEPLPTHAVNINLSKLYDPKQINGLINDVATVIAPQMDLARRGTVPWEQTTEEAHRLFQENEGFMLQRNVGEAANAAQIDATRYVLLSARDKVVSARDKIRKGDVNLDTLIDFKRSLSEHAAVLLQLSGMAAEAGRALNIFRKINASGEMSLSADMLGMRELSTQDMAQWLEANGGIEGIAALAEKHAQLPSPAAQNKAAIASTRMSVWDMSKEWFYNFVLSGPATHMLNMNGNALALGVSTGERAMAAKWGKLFGMLGGKAGVQEGEAAAMVQGYWGAAGDAWRLFNFANRHGESIGENVNYRLPLSMKEIWKMSPTDVQQLAGGADSTGTKMMSGSRGPAITGANVSALLPDSFKPKTKTKNNVTGAAASVGSMDVLDPAVLQERGMIGRMSDMLSKMIDVGGGVLRTPTRLLGAEDQFYKTISFRGEESSLAWREGAGQGLSETDLRNYVDSTLFMADPARSAAAEAFARTVTMTEALTRDTVGRYMQQAGQTRFGQLWFPFVRVGANILDFSTQRMAFPVRAKWWKDLRSGDPVKRDLAMARASTGALAWGTALAFASTGHNQEDDSLITITGAGPTDPKLLAVWRKRGMQEYGMRIGGRGGYWVDYSRFDPAGQMLGIAVDSVNILGHTDEVTGTEFAAALMDSVANNVVNKSYMAPLSNGMEVFHSHDPKMFEKWAQGTIASYAVPNIVSQITAAQDPVLRKALGVAEEITKRSSLIGRGLLPSVRDISGEAVAPSYLFGTRLSGIKAGFEKTDAVADELWRLQLPFSAPTALVNKVKLDEHQYDRYQQLAGHGLKAPPDTMYYGPTLSDGRQIEVDLSGKGMWEALGTLMKTPEYKAATDDVDPPGQKVAAILHIQNRYKHLAQHRLMSEFPELIDKAVDYHQRHLMAGGQMNADEAQTAGAYKRETLNTLSNQAKSFEVVE